MTTDEMLDDLRARGYHPELFAGEGHKHVWLAAVRGYPEQGGDTPAKAMLALMAFVEKKQPMTTRELRKARAG